VDFCTFILLFFRSHNRPLSISKRLTFGSDKYIITHLQGTYVYFFFVDLDMFLHVKKFICLIVCYLATKIETNHQKGDNPIKHSPHSQLTLKHFLEIKKNCNIYNKK